MVVTIRDIGAHAGTSVTIQGWMYNRRSSKKIHFLQVRDGTGRIQGVVARADVDDATWDAAGAMTPESSCEITGTVQVDERAPSGFELHVTGVTVISMAGDYPITKKEHGPDFLLDNRHLWLRSSRQESIIRIRSAFMKAIRDYLDGQGFVNVDSPIFTPNACEGTTTLFETEYFGDKAYLTQSGQLYNEAACMAHRKVYCFGPTFRAEKSKTRRHLTEFWMVEPEMAFCDWVENMAVQEDMLVEVVAAVVKRCRKDFELLGRDLTVLERVVKPFPRIHYDEAVDRLHAAGVAFEWGNDFGAEDETVLANQFDRPFFIHHYPAAVKAFYMKRDPERPDTVLGSDMLAPEGYGEIMGAGQREDDLDALVSRIREHGLPEEAFSWYLDLRRYGSVPHAGFGLGIERGLTWLCGLPHLRETAPFPRMMYRKSP